MVSLRSTWTEELKKEERERRVGLSQEGQVETDKRNRSRSEQEEVVRDR